MFLAWIVQLTVTLSIYTSTRTQLPVTEGLAVLMDITDGMGGILIIDPFQVSYSVMTSIPI